MLKLRATKSICNQHMAIQFVDYHHTAPACSQNECHLRWSSQPPPIPLLKPLISDPFSFAKRFFPPPLGYPETLLNQDLSNTLWAMAKLEMAHLPLLDAAGSRA